MTDEKVDQHEDRAESTTFSMYSADLAYLRETSEATGIKNVSALLRLIINEHRQRQTNYAKEA